MLSSSMDVGWVDTSFHCTAEALLPPPSPALPASARAASLMDVVKMAEFVFEALLLKAVSPPSTNVSPSERRVAHV